NPVEESYEYDQVGNAIASRDGLGRETYQVFDAQNRAVSIDRPAGRGGAARRVTEVFTYDAHGHGPTHPGPGGSLYVTSYDYDRLKRLARTTDAEGQVASWVYDRWGNIREDHAPGGTLLYTYDALNRMLTMTDERGAQYRFVYPGITSEVHATDP